MRPTCVIAYAKKCASVGVLNVGLYVYNTSLLCFVMVCLCVCVFHMCLCVICCFALCLLCFLPVMLPFVASDQTFDVKSGPNVLRRTQFLFLKT